MNSSRHREVPEHLKRLNAALALRDVPDYEAALEQLAKASVVAPRDADVHLVLGLTYQDMKRFDEAEASFRKALGLEPDREAIREALAALLIDKWDFPEVIKLLRPLFERGVENANLWYLYARSLLAEGNEGEFSELVERADALSSKKNDHGRVKARLLQAHAEQLTIERRAEEGLQAAEEGLRLLGSHSGLLKAKENALLKLGCFEEALEIIERLESTGTADLAWDKYMAYHALGEPERALMILESAVLAFGDSYGEMESVAQELFEKGLFEQAAAVAVHALDTGQWRVEFAFDLIPALTAGGEAGRAEQLLKRIIAGGFDASHFGVDLFLDLNFDLIAKVNLGYVYLWMGDDQRAIEELLKAESDVLEKNGDLSAYQLLIACCYQGQIHGPLPEHFEETHILQAIRSNLATAYCLSGDIERALSMARAAVKAYPDYQAYAVLGCVQLAAGNRESARAAWEGALSVEGLDLPPSEDAQSLIQKWLTDLD